jgi:hypothetical protein
VTQSSLLDALAKLKESRLLPSEVDALLEPFRGDVFRFACSFVSASRSLGGQSGPAYSDGYTIICKVGAGETECSVQAFSSENTRIEDLRPGDEFELELKVLGFDSLYQRVLFGQVAKDSGFVEPEESEYENAAKLEALRGVLDKRVSQLQEADDAGTDTVGIQTELPLEGVPEFVVKQDEPREDLPPEEISPAEMEELLREKRSLKRFNIYMKGCGYMLAFGLYGFGGLLCVVGVTSLFDPSPSVFIFLLVGPIMVGIGHVVRKSLRSEAFRNE